MSKSEPIELVHATCIALDSRGALIRGPSGSGKSDLALRCLAIGQCALIKRGAVLIADDQVLVHVKAGRVIAQAPGPLRGLIEVRGQGIITVNFEDVAEVALVVDLVPSGDVIERLPDPISSVCVAGKSIPVLRLHAHEASAAIKVLVALTMRYGHRET